MHTKLPSLQNSIKDQKSRFSFEMDFSHPNSNSNPKYTFFPENVNPMPDFQVSDYLVLDDGIFDDDTTSEKGMAAATELSGATSKNSNMQVISYVSLTSLNGDFSSFFFYSLCWKKFAENAKMECGKTNRKGRYELRLEWNQRWRWSMMDTNGGNMGKNPSRTTPTQGNNYYHYFNLFGLMLLYCMRDWFHWYWTP